MSLSGNLSSQALEQMAIHLSTLEAKRTQKRNLAEDLFKQMQSMNEQIKSMQQQIKDTENELHEVDDEITAAEKGLLEAARQRQQPVRNSYDSIIISENRRSSSATQTQADEVLTDPMTFTMDPDDHVPDPMTQTQAVDDDDDDHNHNFAAAYRPPSRSSSIGPLELTTNNRTLTRRKPPPSTQEAMSIHSSPESETQENNGVEPTVAVASRDRPGTLDSFFNSIPTSSTATAPAPRQSLGNDQNTASIFLPPQQRQGQQQQSNQARQRVGANGQSQSESFPWTGKVDQLLRNTFRINGFRDHQKEIINATLSGQDVFVIMRTGGGKSLTYQLPALVEGRGTERKVSFVISPLLSLIQDQEEQMNEFAAGSAISFTSSIQGGQAEHARRWDMVRDPDQGVCLVFVTPEKVHKSGKLRSEMEKLFNQGRLGRFVIDECHCACQWGHDFRPDYAHLGILKRHFPSIPVIAVTATASDKVRQDCCTILALGTNYRFFRSTANRLNLQYSVQPKPDGKDALVDEMVTFIKEKYPQSAGIIYTLSRKDADTVASSLCEYGVVARAYHSDITPKNKEMVHRSWMRNETQVVVATIAFGLGINKPDVRFVFHHTISKTLEAYYQESGRAGRDGKPADCVLYYSAKDVTRMLKMVHGTSGYQLFWPMVRYAQASGNDAVCRAIILNHLGEPDAANAMEVQKLNDGITTEPRDVGKHAQTVVRLLQLKVQQGEDLTLSMLVKEWRMKPENAPQCVKDLPPGKDLTTNECERIVITLLVESVLDTNVVWTKYDSIVYLKLGRHGPGLASSEDPHIVVRLPKHEKKAAASKETAAAKQSKVRKAIPKDGAWLSAKPKAKVTKRRKAAPKAAKAKATKKVKTKTASRKPATSKRSAKTAAAKPVAENEVIEIASDDDDDHLAEDMPLPLKRQRSSEEALWSDHDDSSEDEFEFLD